MGTLFRRGTTEERHEEMLKKSDFSKRQNAERFIERYEANLLRTSDTKFL